MRALVEGGFADLHHPEYWDLGFVHHAPLKDAYERIVRSIGDALDFFEGISGHAVHEATLVDFYASHEGLHLLYEQAQTRFIPRQNRWYNLSTHMPWIGMRTAALDGAHVEYFRGISNPIGVKVGSAMDAAVAAGAGDDAQSAEPARTADADPPLRRQGRRRGAAQGDRGGAPDGPDGAVGAAIRCTATPRPPPAASRRAASRTSSRSSSSPSASTRSMGSYLGGVHIELTGEDVTECTGGARGLTDRICSAPIARASIRG